MEIKDLILPEAFDKEKALRELDLKYAKIYNKIKHPFLNCGGFRHNNFARNYVKELDEIENRKPVYDIDYYVEVQKLNSSILKKIDTDICIFSNTINFEMSNEVSSIEFNFNEIDLINKQYRLLQEIYYSRLNK